MPAESVGREHVSKKFGNVADFVGFVAMNGIIILAEGVFEEVGPHAVDLGESLADEAVEFSIGALLRAALHHHGAEFGLHSRGKGNLAAYISY